VRRRSALQKTKRESILAFVRETGESSRGEIAREFSLDKKAVSLAVDGLLREGILAVSGYRHSRAGRRRELLAINGGHGVSIGMDLGATHVIGVLADLAGLVLERDFFEIRPGLPVEIILDQMKTIAARLLASPKAAAGVGAVGVCVPGFIEQAEGVSLIAENIAGWRDVRIRELFERQLGKPVRLDDSSRAFAAAERWLGHGRAQKDFIALDLGYGIGLGIFSAGAPLRGADWKSGEIGHTVVNPDGLPCACGNRGCLETVASGRAIARQAAEGIRAGKSQLLRDLTHGDAETATAQDVALAATMADPFSIEVMRTAGAAAGLALANAANILAPTLAVLGGGLVVAGSTLTDAIEESFHRHCMPGIREQVHIAVSALGTDASARGMALEAAEIAFAGA
jgi:N-acetylglucosamine repressor